MQEVKYRRLDAIPMGPTPDTAYHMKSTADLKGRSRTWRILSSPRLALSVLLFLAVFIGTVSWFPWTLDRAVKAPDWATATGLDRPFSSALFLAAVFLLFVNTLACTIERTNGAWQLLNGKIPQRGKILDIDDSFLIGFLK